MNRFFTLFFLSVFLLGCSSSSLVQEAQEKKSREVPPAENALETAATETATPEAAAPAAEQDSPKEAIAYQLALIKDGKADELKLCFTERLRELITPEAVKEAQTQITDMILDELVDQVEEREEDAQKTAVIKMKNGRKLTTLILIDGQWKADTIWFR